MARNDGIDGGWAAEIFPGIASPSSTGAPGSQGVSSSDTTGPVIGSPAVSVPGMSSQLPGGRPVLAVHAGDTSGMSDDLAAHASAIEPGPQAAYNDTGAGEGRSVNAHPNSGA